MRIVHRIATKLTGDKVKAFSAVGLLLSASDRFEVFFIGADDPRRAGILEVANKYQLYPTVHTEFSREELVRSPNLVVTPAWHCGYPQPEDDFGYVEITYNLKDYCRACCTGACQTAPFRMSGEPKWGTKSILQLNWVFDEFFVTPEVYESVFKPFGISNLPVLKHKTGAELQTVVQLHAPLSVDLEMGDRSFEICPVCSRRRYRMTNAGFYPRPVADTAEPIFRSTQWFGSGFSSDNRIMIANRVYKEIVNSKIKGADFNACEQ